MLAWEIHNHWSHCWALIRPAVSSLKGQKSIRLHYCAGSVVNTSHSPEQAYMRTRLNNTKTKSVTWLSSCLMGFAQFDVCVLLIMWLRGDGLYCDTRPFSEEKCNSFFLFLRSNSLQYSHEDRSTWQALNDELRAYFFGLTLTVLFYVCLVNNAYEDLTWRYGPLLMFVCHNNMFVLMFVVVYLLFYWLSYFFFVLVLTYLWKF